MKSKKTGRKAPSKPSFQHDAERHPIVLTKLLTGLWYCPVLTGFTVLVSAMAIKDYLAPYDEDEEEGEESVQ